MAQIGISINKASTRKIAEEIADYLFVSPFEFMIAGWGREAVRDAIIDRLESLNHKPEPGIGDILRPEIDGITYEPEHDQKRLMNLAKRVKALMLDGKWRTLGEIKAETGGGEASISARLRDLRKHKYGGWAVDRRRRGDAAAGLHEYRLCKTNEVW